MLSEDKDKLEPEISELVNEIGKAAKVMLNLVIDFLEITQLDAGESKYIGIRRTFAPSLSERFTTFRKLRRKNQSR